MQMTTMCDCEAGIADVEGVTMLSVMNIDILPSCSKTKCSGRLQKPQGLGLSGNSFQNIDTYIMIHISSFPFTMDELVVTNDWSKMTQ